MAKNEAKIKFTAETGDFNNAISKANSTMTELRAELKLTETRMKTTGASVEALKGKHSLLKSELEAAREKTEALSKKLEVAKKHFGENSTEVSKLKTQLANAKTAEVKLEKAVDDCAEELEEHEKKSKDSKDALEKLEKASGDARDGLDKVKTGLSNLGTAFGTAASTIGNAAKTIGTTIVGIGTAFAGSVVAVAEGTREYRTEMGKLDAAFSASGFNADTASDAYSKLYGIIGETDQSVEAAQQIALLADSEEEVAKWAELASGVVGTFGDALQPETFFESANETLKLGEATGAYTQMLEGCGLSVEDFNAGLAACTTESDKQAYMLSVAKSALGDAGTAYEENNAAIIESNNAQARFTEALATFGEKAEPILTAVKDGFAKVLEKAGSFLTSFDTTAISTAISGAFDWFISNAVPAIQAGIQWVIDNKDAFAGFFSGVGELVGTAFSWFVDNALPVITSAIEWVITNKDLVLALITGIAAGFAAWNIVQIVSGAITAFNSFKTTIDLVKTGQVALNTVLNANPLAIIITVIAAVVAAFIYLWNNCEGFRNFWINLWENVKSVFSAVGEWLGITVNAIWETIQAAWDGIGNTISTVINTVQTVVSSVWETIKTVTSDAFNAVWNTITDIWNGISNTVSGVVNGVWDTISGIWESIKSTTSSVFGSIWDTVTGIWNGIKDAISTPIQAACDFVQGIIDDIKGFFSFTITWPKIPMPHFSLKPKGWKIGDLLQGSIPTLGIDWYAKGGIMTRPTIFGMNGNRLMAGGEAGPEAILPIDRLEGYIYNAIDRKMGAMNLQHLADAIEDLADRPISLNLNGRQIALAMASDSDSVNGLRSTFKSRGLVLD